MPELTHEPLAKVMGERLKLKSCSDGISAMEIMGIRMSHQEARALVIQIIRTADFGTYEAKRRSVKAVREARVARDGS